MDEDLRRLNAASRVGLGRHAALVGKACRVDGVRTSYRFILDSVVELGGGVAVLLVSNCRALEALADCSGEVMVGDLEIYSHAILGIGPMPTNWPSLG